MPSVKVGDVGLYYEESGSGEPLLLVHGIPTDYRAWAFQTGALSANHRVVAVSRRYAAPNVREGDLLDSTVDNNAADLLGLIGELSLGPVHLVGHSYGGFISALIAKEHPDAVRSLVLVEPAVSTMLVSDQGSQSAVLGLLLRSPSVALSARRFQAGSLGPSLKALDGGETGRAVELNVDGIQEERGAFGRMPEEVRKMMLDNGRTIGELRTRFPSFTASEAGKIACRTLIVSGESSPLWLRRIATLLCRSMPNARLETVSGARHFPHLENPQEFNRKVLQFIDGGKGQG